MATPRPQNVGIIAIEVYFPSSFVNQDQLEIFDKVSTGKYTKGLGQNNMAFVGDREDICSICMTAVSSLMRKYNIPYSKVGRLEVGSESPIDKSKSIKTVIMQLFQDNGNTDVEGVDCVNACYGGTAALFNAIHWIESSSWDSRFAVVVAGDIAVYAPGPARPTGGCGAIAMLIGPNAPLVVDLGCKSSYFENAYDFYKPVLSSEYPTVDGQYSIECYLRSLENCYAKFKLKWKSKYSTNFNLIQDADYAIFHTPFCKLVQKAVARLYHQEVITHPELTTDHAKVIEQSKLGSRELDQFLISLSSDLFNKKTASSLLLAKEIGNIYCGSLYAALISLISSESSPMQGKNILAYSYGSGISSSLFMIRVQGDISSIVSQCDVLNRLKKRVEITPEIFTECLAKREKSYGAHSYSPSDSLFSFILPGTFYLQHIDDRFKHVYVVKENDMNKVET